MARESAQVKGLRYLVEHRLLIGEVTADRVRATVRGSGEVYRLGFEGGRWFCGCPARTNGCSHLHALRAVTVVPRSPRP